MTEQREPPTITSREQLAALPEGAVLRDVADGTLWVRNNEQWVWVFGPYYGFGNERQPIEQGPSYLLFHPGWEPSGLDEFHPDSSWNKGEQ